MIIRNGFVTNSSSSSFVVVNVKSKMIHDILEEFQDEIKKMVKSSCGYLSLRDDGTVIIEQEDGYIEQPHTLMGILTTLASLIDSDFYAYEDDEDEGDQDYSRYSEVVQRLMEDKAAALDSIEKAEVTFEEQGWQGDSDCRYDPEWYEKKALRRIRREIAKELGYDSVKEITEEDFDDYVCDKISLELVEVTYDKKTGKIQSKRSTELE